MKLGLQLHVNGSKALDKKHCLHIYILSQTVSILFSCTLPLLFCVSLWYRMQIWSMWCCVVLKCVNSAVTLRDAAASALMHIAGSGWHQVHHHLQIFFNLTILCHCIQQLSPFSPSSLTATSPILCSDLEEGVFSCVWCMLALSQAVALHKDTFESRLTSCQCWWMSTALSSGSHISVQWYQSCTYL